MCINADELGNEEIARWACFNLGRDYPFFKKRDGPNSTRRGQPQQREDDGPGTEHSISRQPSG